MIWLLVRHTALPQKRDWKHLLMLGLLLNSAPGILFAFGETHISSSLAGIINAATPLASIVFSSVILPTETLSSEKIRGILLGFLGILILVGVWNGVGKGDGAGAAACIAAIICYGLAFPYAKRTLSTSTSPPAALAAAQVLCGTALLVPVAINSTVIHNPFNARTIAAMLALGVLGSGLESCSLVKK